MPRQTKPTNLKFEKNAFYEDSQGDLWMCLNGRTRKTPDGHQVVDMQPAPGGHAAGEADERYIDTLVRKLSAKELVEYREIAQREVDALAAAAAMQKPATEKADRRMSALDAAAKVLGESAEPMAAKEMIDAMAAKGYWTSPGGKTPQATLYSAILREIQKKGAEARFAKTERGHFTLASQ